MSSYIDYYSLNKQPFGAAPNVDFYCDIENNYGALEAIIESLHHGDSFIKVTGVAGVGKTLLLNRLVKSLDESFKVCKIMSPDLDSYGIRTALAEELDINFYNTSPLRLLNKIHHDLLQLLHKGKRTVLLIDEAQLLTDSALEALRILINLENNSTKLLQIVIFGQPSLDARLHSEEMSQVLQRINQSLYLYPLNLKDMDLYLTQRLVIAGHPSGQLFTVAAKRKLHKLTQGVPSLINIVCCKALLLSYQRGMPYVDLKEVQYAISDCFEILHSTPKRKNYTSIVIASLVTVSFILLSIIVFKLFMYSNGHLLGVNSAIQLS
jgi:MSHA biogenesis protein MshM